MTTVAFVAAFGAGAASADQIAIPSQDEWDSARQISTLPSGQTIGYVEMGNTEGDPLVLIHGYTDNSRSWSLLTPELADRHIFAVDLRGHGASAAPECCYTLMDFSHDLEGFLLEQKIETTDIVGHSLGSMTAALFAAQHPDMVDRLVLISTAAAMPEASGDWLWENVPQLPEALDPDGEFMNEWYWNPNPVPADFIDRERAESAATPKHVWMGVLEALTITDWSPNATRIETPTLVLWGDQDELFGEDAQDLVKRILPEARHETYEGYGHNMFWETPGTVGLMIEAFLSE
ncbi:alpha/beta fold hydrolase [Paracoccus liaowanqingii]|uniref:alpha/beta fold hydrolase n=1 Tax=Paracoccus liaowanqingii TaxID=2560053 RepID=UPI00143D56D4|nr:alpha/beta hydrolase [Paracoccus liaowanqingii]